MVVKAINNLVGLDGIVPILLVFGAYLRIIDIDPPSLSIVQQAEAICNVSKEVQRLHAKRQVANALAIRNRPNTKPVLDLLIQSDVRVQREKGGWKGLYKLLATDRETYTIDIPYRPTNFRTTVVKLYYREEDLEDQEKCQKS